MAFGSIVFLLLFYYIRPQDWVPGMSGFNMIKLVVAGGILGLMKRDPGEPRWRFMSCPEEWALMAFYLFAVFTASDFTAAALDLGPLVVFAFLGVHTLTTEKLLERYLNWWLIALVGVLIMVVLTQMGVDVTNATQLIDMYRGRFCLNTYTLNNPNALGHTLVAVLPLGYYLWFWDNTVISRVRALVLFVVGVGAVIPTESKGAFISGAVSFMVSVLFGRKVMVQIIVGMAALAMGGTILAMLPRMEGMKNLGGDQGVQGRMLAWRIARTVTLNRPTGMGYKQFVAMVSYEHTLEDKSTHSSFVKVGGDLGVIGLTLYIGMLTVCGRSLIQYRGLTRSMECCRRVLFALLVGMCISGWMINREYYTEVFCMIGAIAAYHQISVRQRRDAALEEMEKQAALSATPGEPEVVPFGLPLAANRAFHARTMSKAADNAGAVVTDLTPGRVQVPDQVQVPRLWTRIGVVDVLVAIVMTQLALQFWDYILATIK